MEKCKCQHPDLISKDGKCSEEQIKDCHGDEEHHPCDREESDKN